MDGLIEVKNVKKAFKINKREKGLPGMLANMIKPQYEIKNAVEDVSFTIKEGEMTGFIGPNGAGKSTMIKMLSGILHPDDGIIKVGEYIPYKHRKKYVANIGVVFGQKSQLHWDLPSIDSFELLKSIYRIPEAEYKRNLDRYVTLLNMSSFLNQPVRQLSLGQRMRADIVAALLHNPKIIFFDEPTIGVDVAGKEVIRKFIKDLNKEDKITMLFTTHDMQDIEKTCNRLIILDEGKKVYDGSLVGIRDKYSTLRKVEVEFSDNVRINPIRDVKISKINEGYGRKYSFIFENKKVKIDSLMEEILSNYKVQDIHIAEPEIEGIIRKIYNNDEMIGGEIF